MEFFKISFVDLICLNFKSSDYIILSNIFNKVKINYNYFSFYIFSTNFKS